MGSMASTSSSKTIESWVLAAVSTTASGMPLRSETRWRFEPAFPLSVGFLPVFVPPFCRDGSRVQRGSFPIYPVGLSEAIQEDLVQALPHPGLLPLAQASPAGDAGAATHLL